MKTLKIIGSLLISTAAYGMEKTGDEALKAALASNDITALSQFLAQQRNRTLLNYGLIEVITKLTEWDETRLDQLRGLLSQPDVDKQRALDAVLAQKADILDQIAKIDAIIQALSTNALMLSQRDHFNARKAGLCIRVDFLEKAAALCTPKE